MITNYLPYILGASFFLLGIYIFLVSFKIYKPQFKSDERKVKHDIWLQKFGSFAKPASILLILNGGYDLIYQDVERYRYFKPKTEWNNEIKDSMVVGCLREAKVLSAKYPDIAICYCECAFEKTSKKMSSQEYLTIVNNPNEKEKADLIMPTIQGCLDEVKRKIAVADSLASVHNNQ